MKASANLQIVLSFRQQLARTEETESYQVEVVRAPGRGWGGPFSPLGLDESHTLALRQLYRQYLERAHTRGETLDERAVEALRVAGNQLFQAFPETVQERLRQTQALARQQGQGVDLVLAFQPNARPLLALPWELLHDPEARVFWTLTGNTLTRQLWLSSAPALAPDFRPQKMVGVWAEPEGGMGLEVRAQYAPAPGKGETIHWLTGPDSLGQLARALETEPFDGLHLVAHGRAGAGWRDFSLALADAQNAQQWISPDQLAGFLAGFPALRFVYLDVCEAGGKYEDGDTQPGGLATGLLGVGISAVIAMQDTVSQHAAGQLAQTFYAHLTQGQPLPEALSAARRAVRVGLDDPLHWSVPTLYVQQKLEESVSYPTRVADYLLDRITDLVRPEGFVGVAVCLLAGWLAQPLAALDLAHLADWRALALPVTLSIFLVLMGAWSMQAGQHALGEKYELDRRGWVEVLLHKYTAAAVWSFGWWGFLWVGSLACTWLGISAWLEEPALRISWAFGLSGVAGAAYVGARQGIRQSRLFMSLGRSQHFGQDVLLFLTMPLVPVLLAWLLASSWQFLTGSWAGFLLTVGMCLLLAWIARETGEAYSEEK
ncbi:MAG: CHAT domain-containing protein [Anaerolineales bacterium]|nr:CHAT domain-containing protein [Anaerolineales bacterium]